MYFVNGTLFCNIKASRSATIYIITFLKDLAMTRIQIPLSCKTVQVPFIVTLYMLVLSRDVQQSPYVITFRLILPTFAVARTHTLYCRTLFNPSWAGSATTTGDIPKSNGQTRICHKSYRRHSESWWPSIVDTDADSILLCPKNSLNYITCPHHSTLSPGTSNQWSEFRQRTGRDPGFVKGKQKLIFLSLLLWE